MPKRKSRRNKDFIGTLDMNNNIHPPVQNQNVGNDVVCAFLLHPINLNTGKVNYKSLQSIVNLKVSGSIEKGVSQYAAGHGFDWANIFQLPDETVQAIQNKKWEALLCLLVYNHCLDIELDTSEMYLLIEKHGHIILTTQSLMKDDIGYVAKSIRTGCPLLNRDLIRCTDLHHDDVEFYILVHQLVESDAQGNQIGKHTLVTFEPLEHADYSTQSFDFLKAHAERDQVKSPFQHEFHYDFFHQNWDVVKGVSSDGVLPNGNTLRFERSDSF